MLYVILYIQWQELRKDGFDLAETRYKELKPILDEVTVLCYFIWYEAKKIFGAVVYIGSLVHYVQLAVLEAEQKAEEEASASTSSKKDTKKPKQKSAGR